LEVRREIGVSFQQWESRAWGSIDMDGGVAQNKGMAVVIALQAV
jgi:hypothetical protein